MRGNTRDDAITTTTTTTVAGATGQPPQRRHRRSASAAPLRQPLLRDAAAATAISPRRWSCETCRRRKIRCDGVRPACGFCSRRALSTSSDAVADLPPCVYLGSRIRPDSVASSTAASSTTTTAIAVPLLSHVRQAVFASATILPDGYWSPAVPGMPAPLDEPRLSSVDDDGAVRPGALPSEELELCALFFNCPFVGVGFIHQRTFYDSLLSRNAAAHPPAMLRWGICAMSSFTQPHLYSREVSLWYLERARSLAASDIDDVTTIRVQALLTVCCALAHSGNLLSANLLTSMVTRMAQILVTDEDLPAANDEIVNWVEPILLSGQTPVKSPCSETIWTSLDPPEKLLSRSSSSSSYDRLDASLQDWQHNLPPDQRADWATVELPMGDMGAMLHTVGLMEMEVTHKGALSRLMRYRIVDTIRKSLDTARLEKIGHRERPLFDLIRLDVDEQLHVATWIKYAAATATSIAVIVRRLLTEDQKVFLHYGPRVMFFSVLEAALSIVLADAITTTTTPVWQHARTLLAAKSAGTSNPASPTSREAMDAFIEFFRRLQDLLPATSVLYAIVRPMNVLDPGFLRRLFALELQLEEMREQSALWDGLSALSLSHPANVERAAERQVILSVLEAGAGVGTAAGGPAFSPVPAPVPAPAPAPAPMLLASVEWAERMRLLRDYLREVALTTAVIVLTGTPDALPPPPLSKDRSWPAAAALRANKPADATATGATTADTNDDGKEFDLLRAFYAAISGEANVQNDAWQPSVRAVAVSEIVSYLLAS
ncbi:hypothetical protein HK405_006477 [Cladochytrium tenue]|nr:hypothetical protein HK405_006477 [Cladochytrium tenue]